MLAIYGFATIVVFLVLIMTKRLSVITALVVVPIVFAFMQGLIIQRSVTWHWQE